MGNECVMENVNSKNKRIPFGILTIMILQILIIAYCIVRSITLMNVINMNGTEFGIKDINYLRLFYLVMGAVNVFSLIGMFKKLNWGRNMFFLQVSVILIFEAIQVINVLNRYSIRSFIYRGSFEIIVVSICIVCIIYLVTSKKAKEYFSKQIMKED